MSGNYGPSWSGKFDVSVSSGWARQSHQSPSLYHQCCINNLSDSAPEREGELFVTVNIISHLLYCQFDNNVVGVKN